jgi:hypothetical protein
MLSPETTDEVAVLVRSGFYEKHRLMDVFCEEMYAPGELDPDEVSATIDAEFEKWEAEKQAWPDVTDCDRLDSAFAAMRILITSTSAGTSIGNTILV